MLRLLVILLANPSAATIRSLHDAPLAPSLIGFQVKRTIALTIGHSLDVAEAKRRVAERFASLQKQFVGQASESSMVWDGDAGNVRVVAYGQVATAKVLVRETAIEIHVALPAVLAPVGGNIQDFLNKTAIDTLKP